MIDEQRLKEIERIYDLDRVENPNYAKYVRELINGCRALNKENDILMQKNSRLKSEIKHLQMIFIVTGGEES